jgi:hypothetical protein
MLLEMIQSLSEINLTQDDWNNRFYRDCESWKNCINRWFIKSQVRALGLYFLARKKFWLVWCAADFCFSKLQLALRDYAGGLEGNAELCNFKAWSSWRLVWQQDCAPS